MCWLDLENLLIIIAWDFTFCRLVVVSWVADVRKNVTWPILSLYTHTCIPGCKYAYASTNSWVNLENSYFGSDFRAFKQRIERGYFCTIVYFSNLFFSIWSVLFIKRWKILYLNVPSASLKNHATHDY